MKIGYFICLAALFLGGCASTTPTRTTEHAFMVIDVKGDSSIRDRVLDAVIQTAQENMDSLTVNRGIPPSTLPEMAPRFELVDPLANTQLSGVMGGLAALSGTASMQVPSCSSPLLTMKSTDTTMEWGERTTFFICVVQYQEGYHVDIYTTFEQQSGGLSANALGVTLARSMVGDTSQIIPRTMKRIESALVSISSDTKVVDSYIPQKWKGFFLDEASTVQTGQ